MKTINKTMTNNDIYMIATSFLNNFETNDVRMPAAIAYAIQKNKASLIAIGQEIEKSRVEIIQHYGTMQEDGQFMVPAEFVDQANKELADLLKIEEDVKIYMININELNDVSFTAKQMETLMFMIEEGE